MQREKILKDKEMRRRKAAEELKNPAVATGGDASNSLNTIDTVATSTKLSTTVTTVSDGNKKSTIVLKKKPPTDGVGGGRTNIPTAKVFPESKRTTTAVVKPVVKQQQPLAPPVAPKPAPAAVGDKKLQQQQHNIAFDIDEDNLLADSPSTSPTSMSTKQTTAATTARFANRRVVLKTRSSDAKFTAAASSANATAAAAVHKNEDGATNRTISNKGIFDRLDRKVTTVNVVSEASKRKIQRIVVQNTD